MAGSAENGTRPQRPLSPADPGQDRALLEHYYLPGDLERQVAAFVAHYNHARYDESLGDLMPADVYFGRAETILLERERIKHKQSPIVACSINCMPHNLNRRRSRASLLEAGNMSQII